MDAAFAIAALPVTVGVLWALLRSPLGGRLVAHPTGERWHETATPTFGGVGLFLGFVAGITVALATGALECNRGQVHHVAGVPLLQQGSGPSCCRRAASATSRPQSLAGAS